MLLHPKISNCLIHPQIHILQTFNRPVKYYNNLIALKVFIYIICYRFFLLFVVCFFNISHSSQCSMTGVTKAVVCAILSVGWCI